MRKVKKIKLQFVNDFVIVNNQHWRYSHEGKIFLIYTEDILLENPLIIENLVKEGYTTMRVLINNKLIDLPINFKYIGNQDRRRNISFDRKISKSEVSESYRFVISVEIKGKEINNFYVREEDSSVRFLNYACENEYPAVVSDEKIKLFGKPVKQEPGSIFWEYPIWRTSKEFRQPFSSIDKIIGTKKFYTTDAIGDEDEVANTKFTGKEERIVLDLHNFDESIYHIFMAHNNCVDIEWESSSSIFAE